MLSGGHEYEPPQKVLQIKKDDKFFSRLLSKEISSKGSEPSFRVLYYGGSRGAVPFMWESQPGIPKHRSSEYSSLPPLTPPPSYQLSPKKTKSMQLKRSNSIKPNFLFTLFPRTASKKNHVSSALSSSSSYSSSSTPMTPCVLGRSRSTVGFGVDEDDDDQGGMSPTSSLCFGVRGGFCKEFRSKVND